jgi:hypothetical protein
MKAYQISLEGWDRVIVAAPNAMEAINFALAYFTKEADDVYTADHIESVLRLDDFIGSAPTAPGVEE